MLLGASIGLLIVGLSDGVGRLIRMPAGLTPPPVSTTLITVSAALAALAAGVRIPQQFAIWIFRFAGGRPGGMEEQQAIAEAEDADPTFRWTALAVVALVCGVSIALLPLWHQAVAAGYSLALARFVWSDLFWVPLLWFTAMTAGLLPLILLGMAVTCAGHVPGPASRSDTIQTGWPLVGAAGGLLVAGAAEAMAFPANARLLVAALPVLSVGLAAGLLAAAAPDLAPRSQALPAAPVRRDQRPRLLRAAIVVVGACIVALLGVSSGETSLPLAARAMLFAGVGTLLGQAAVRKIGGSSDVFVWVCLWGAAVILAAWLAAGSSIPRGATPLEGLVLFAAGCAFGAGRAAVIAQTGGGPTPGRVLGRTLLVGSVIMLAVPILSHRVGIRGLLLVVAMALLTIGATAWASGSRHSTMNLRTLVGSLRRVP